MPRIGVIPRLNPFSTRFTAPGAIPFQFSGGRGAESVAAELEANGGWGQIIGPHGSGKTSLLTALVPSLTTWNVRSIRLSATQRKLPAITWNAIPWRGLLVIDGFEQLGVLTRSRVKQHCRRTGCGLLITAHRSMGLPDLYRTDVTAELAAVLISDLVGPGEKWVLAGYDIPARLQRHRGSLRELLFELYDRWEAREGG